jgi:molecular chaperone IbpA
MWDVNHKFKDFDRFFVGFDPIAKKLADASEQATKLVTNYPPFNLKKIGENKYAIELAVAGFAKQHIDIELANDLLVITGKLESDTAEDGTSFLYRGISGKPFRRTFTLADNVEIKSADLANGILKIWLEALAPKSENKKIEIK